MEKQWKSVSGYEDLYEVSNFGEVRRKNNGAVLLGSINSYGYRVVKLTRNGKGKDFKMHQLVAKAFIPNDFGARIINHKDGNRQNNKAENLEWCTHKQNARHAIDVLGVSTFSRPVAQISLDGELIAIWSNANKAAATLNLSHMLILACCKGTSQTAYDFVWRYYDFNIAAAAKNIKRATLERKIEQLSAELAALA